MFWTQIKNFKSLLYSMLLIGLAHSLRAMEQQQLSSSSVPRITTEYANLYAAQQQATNRLSPERQRSKFFLDVKPFNPKFTESVLATCPSSIVNRIHRLREVKYFTNAAPTMLILYGPPGSGKSTIGKAIAFGSNRRLLFKQAAFLCNEYKNSGSTALLEILEEVKAIKEPCVILLDEINLLADRGKNPQDSDKDVAEAICAFVDGCKEYDHVVIVGTTNDLDCFSKQVRDRITLDVFEVPQPTLAQREKIARSIAQAYELIIPEPVFKGFLRKVANVSIREMEAHIKEAKAVGLERLLGESNRLRGDTDSSAASSQQIELQPSGSSSSNPADPQDRPVQGNASNNPATINLPPIVLTETDMQRALNQRQRIRLLFAQSQGIPVFKIMQGGSLVFKILSGGVILWMTYDKWKYQKILLQEQTKFFNKAFFKDCFKAGCVGLGVGAVYIFKLFKG